MKKRADGRYQKKLQITAQDGTTQYKVIYARTKADLMEKERKLLYQLEQGIFANRDRTIRDYSERWLETVEPKNGIRTQEQYISIVKKINDRLGAITLQNLKRSDIQLLINEYCDRPRSAQMIKIILHKILECAVDDEIINRNVCRGIVLPEYKAKEKRPLTEIEKRAIQDADFSDEERLFISLLYYTGMRRGEALALSRKDVDLKNRIITVNHSLTFVNNRGIIKDPKTKTSKREIPIPDALYGLLKRSNCFMYYFTRNGEMLSKTAYNCFWERIMKKLNAAAGSDPDGIQKIQGLTAHIFRHNYATMLHDNGVDMKTAQHLLGHSSIQVTMDIYTHLDGIKEDTRDQVNDMFKVKTS